MKHNQQQNQTNVYIFTSYFIRYTYSATYYMPTFNQPITWQTFSGIRYVDMVKTTC